MKIFICITILIIFISCAPLDRLFEGPDISISAMCRDKVILCGLVARQHYEYIRIAYGPVNNSSETHVQLQGSHDGQNWVWLDTIPKEIWVGDEGKNSDFEVKQYLELKEFFEITYSDRRLWLKAPF